MSENEEQIDEKVEGSPEEAELSEEESVESEDLESSEVPAEPEEQEPEEPIECEPLQEWLTRMDGNFCRYGNFADGFLCAHSFLRARQCS